MSKKTTQADILERWRTKQGVHTKSEFADLLGWSKQLYNNALNGTQINHQTLSDLSLNFTNEWRGVFAIELLIFHNENIPCRCQTAIGDCGICPRHIEITKELAVVE